MVPRQLFHPRSVGFSLFFFALWSSLLHANRLEAQGPVRILKDLAFPSDTGYIDLSTRLLWGTNSQVMSAFRSEAKVDRWGLEKVGLTLSDSGYRYLNWHAPASLKTCNSLDIPFSPVEQDADSLVIETDVFWDTLTNSGEAGRLNFMLLHQYPAGGPAFGMTDSLNALPMPFGRPAYHFRIVPRPTAIQGYRGFYSYGGNNDSLGKLYWQTNTLGQPVWWLPGAVPVSGPGFSEAMAYPRTPFVPFSSDRIPERKTWITLTWTLGREIHQVFSRRSIFPADSNRLAYRMFFPRLSVDTRERLSAWYGIAVDTLPFLYRNFPVTEALRIYALGQIRTWWGGVRIRAYPLATSTAIKPGLAGVPQPLSIGVSDRFLWIEARHGQFFELYSPSGKQLGGFRLEDGIWRIPIPDHRSLYVVRGRDVRGVPVQGKVLVLD